VDILIRKSWSSKATRIACQLAGAPWVVGKSARALTAANHQASSGDESEDDGTNSDKLGTKTICWDSHRDGLINSVFEGKKWDKIVTSLRGSKLSSKESPVGAFLNPPGSNNLEDLDSRGANRFPLG